MCLLFRLFMMLSIVAMLILIPNGVAVVEFFIGDCCKVKFDAGDLGRLIKSSFCNINPLLGAPIGDLSSCDEGDESSDDGFLRQTSR